VDTLQRKYSELLADMKRTEREHIKSKKRGDQLQKEKDSQRSELTKSNSMKEKLEKLSRELTKENKKLKVRTQLRPRLCAIDSILIAVICTGGSPRAERKRRRQERRTSTATGEHG
jgi:chromosome segregation ATPase